MKAPKLPGALPPDPQAGFHLDSLGRKGLQYVSRLLPEVDTPMSMAFALCYSKNFQCKHISYFSHWSSV